MGEIRVNMDKAETRPRHVRATVAPGVCGKVMSGRLRKDSDAEQCQKEQRLSTMPALGM